MVYFLDLSRCSLSESLLVERAVQGGVPAAVQVPLPQVLLLPVARKILQRALRHVQHRLHMDAAGDAVVAHRLVLLSVASVAN